MSAVEEFRRDEKVRLDVLKRFGFYSTESNGHLSEYLPWYRKRPGEIERWISLTHWINGETGGYLRVCTEGRNWFESDFPNWMKEEPPVIGPGDRSEEHGSYIIESLETGRPYRGHFNVPNQGNISNLPNGCIVEIPGYVDRNGVNMPIVGDLPLACAATCSVSARVQEMGMEAAVRADVNLLKQGVLHDPLTAAVCDPEEVWQMCDEMLVAQAQWLPQYRANGEIERAKQRLAAHERDGTRVRLRMAEGTGRVRPREVGELAQDKQAARVSAQAADKAGMTK
jgi:alpha-galactosidase